MMTLTLKTTNPRDDEVDPMTASVPDPHPCSINQAEYS